MDDFIRVIPEFRNDDLSEDERSIVGSNGKESLIKLKRVLATKSIETVLEKFNSKLTSACDLDLISDELIRFVEICYDLQWLKRSDLSNSIIEIKNTDDDTCKPRLLIEKAEESGLSHEEIGSICGVNAGSVARWKSKDRAKTKYVKRLVKYIEDTGTVDKSVNDIQFDSDKRTPGDVELLREMSKRALEIGVELTFRFIK